MPSSSTPSLVWFRQDLRLADNPALTAALAEGAPLLPVFVLDEAAAGSRAPGGASCWWLHHSLAALARDLEARGSRLLLLRGAAEELIPRLAAETGARAVHWNRCYEPWRRARDARIKQRLKQAGVAAASHNAALLAEPWTLKTGAGQPYKVFTPFWKALRGGSVPRPEPAPGDFSAAQGPAQGPAGDRLEDWALLPQRPDWAAGLRASWLREGCGPGEAGAQARLQGFLEEAVAAYGEDRDRPDREGSSRLSPHLHHGEIGPRQVWHAALHHAQCHPGSEAGVWKFLSELGWREFSHHLLYAWPELPDRSWKPAFERFPWAEDEAGLEAWRRGRTGYPLVDAGMRQLWQEGWIHNRVRMIVASFLVKHLLQPWQRGEAWFWDTLVDADLANNAAGWQWVAGSGADAAPYFRIFNPVIQGEKFDPRGGYLRRWLPELAALPDRWLHRPWEAPAEVLSAAGVELGRSYPVPIVDHAAARARALAAFQKTKGEEAA